LVATKRKNIIDKDTKITRCFLLKKGKTPVIFRVVQNQKTGSRNIGRNCKVYQKTLSVKLTQTISKKKPSDHKLAHAIDAENG
jgi:hypothetical protein